MTHANRPDGSTVSQAKTLPDWKPLWDMKDPAASETRFRSLLESLDSDAPPAYVLEVRTQIARTYSLRARFDDAHTLLNELDPLITEDMPRVRVRYLLERGRTHNSNNEKEKARVLFVEAYTLARAAGEEALAMDAAHMVGIAAEPEEALKWSHMAIEMAEQSRDVAVRNWLGPLYNNTGWTYEERGEYATALTLFEKGLTFRLENGWNEGAVISLYTVGHTQRKMGQLDRAQKTLQEVEQRWKELGREPDGYTCEELGEVFLARAQPEKARPYFARAYQELSQDSWLQDNEPARLERLKTLAGL